VEGAEVDCFGGVGFVGNGDGFACTLVADGEVAEEFFGLGARAVDFLLAQSDAALFFGFVFVAFFEAGFAPEAVGLAALFDALGFALLVCFGFGFGFGFCVGGLLGLFALDFRVLGGVP
jgi:hypothetical protein